MTTSIHDSPRATPPYDPMDPHGFHAGETHGHHIVSQRMLVAVLTVLLIFTLLTVAASRAEVWIAETFDVAIPQSVNVLVAMSIALVKGTLVALFFMQLLYDKALNAIIFCFCLLGLALFLGFSALDLGGRDTIYRWKVDQQTPGGIGQLTYIKREASGEPVVDPETGEPIRETITGSLAEYARQNEDFVRGRLGEKAYQKLVAKHDAQHGHHHELSTPNRAVPMHGLMLFAEPSHGSQDHAQDNAGDQASPESAQPEPANHSTQDPSTGG